MPDVVPKLYDCLKVVNTRVSRSLTAHVIGTLEAEGLLRHGHTSDRPDIKCHACALVAEAAKEASNGA